MAVYALRTMKVDESDWPEFARLSVEAIWPYWWPTVGSETVGLWRTVMGPHELVLLHRYRDLWHWEDSRRHRYMSPPEDPEVRRRWQARLDAGNRRWELIRDSIVKAIQPLAGSPTPRGVLGDGSYPVDELESEWYDGMDPSLEPPSPTGRRATSGPGRPDALYAIRSFNVHQRDWPELGRRSRADLWPYRWRQLGVETVGLFRTLFGEHYEVLALERYRDIDHWQLASAAESDPTHDPGDREASESWTRFQEASAWVRSVTREVNSTGWLQLMDGAPVARGVLEDGSFVVDEDSHPLWAAGS